MGLIPQLSPNEEHYGSEMMETSHKQSQSLQHTLYSSDGSRLKETTPLSSWIFKMDTNSRSFTMSSSRLHKMARYSKERMDYGRISPTTQSLTL
jgi:hypothetical protein